MTNATIIDAATATILLDEVWSARGEAQIEWCQMTDEALHAPSPSGEYTREYQRVMAETGSDWHAVRAANVVYRRLLAEKEALESKAENFRKEWVDELSDEIEYLMQFAPDWQPA